MESSSTTGRAAEAIPGIASGEDDRALPQPCILQGTRDDMRIAQQELFGPACVVMPIDSFEEGLKDAGDIE